MADMVAKTDSGGHVRYAQLLNTRAEQKKLTLRDVANKTGFTYEHVRKVFNGGSFPSRFMLQELCKVLDLPLQELEQIVVTDRIKIKYGQQLRSYSPDSELMSTWGRLTDEQRNGIRILISGYIRQNELRKAG